MLCRNASSSSSIISASVTIFASLCAADSEGDTESVIKPRASVEAVSEDAVLSNPKFGKWNALRGTDHAAYPGLTLPRYLLRKPWVGGSSSPRGNAIGYTETVHPGQTGDPSHFLWGNAAILFAKNMVRRT